MFMYVYISFPVWTMYKNSGYFCYLTFAPCPGTNNHVTQFLVTGFAGCYDIIEGGAHSVERDASLTTLHL